MGKNRPQRARLGIAAILAATLAGCGSAVSPTGTGGARVGGGVPGSGGVQGSGGAPVSTGGSIDAAVPSHSGGGERSTGGAGSGGVASGGVGAGGVAGDGGQPGTGGVRVDAGGAMGGAGRPATGGIVTTGGMPSTGGTSTTGGMFGAGGVLAPDAGQATGGTVTGGIRTGGVATGGIPSGPGALYNGIQWADTAGKPIQAHGGGILKDGAYYYWFGENRNPDGTFFAVSCYRSTDLVNWEFRRHVLTQDSAAELKPANIERPKVVRNDSTGKYVLWMHYENGKDYGEARAAVASSDTVDGVYTYHGSARPLVNSGVVDHDKPGHMSRDCGLFVDTDGKGYFISATNENYDLNLYRLTPDYLKIEALAATLFKGGHREAPVLWKRNGVYFLLTSGATGWDPNQAKYATSSSLTSGWSAMANVGDGTTFHSQSTYVVAVQGAGGTSYLYLGDRWAGAWGKPVNDSTYVAQVITFPSTITMTMTWNNTIAIDVAAGTVTGTTNKFKFVNKASGKAIGIEGASTEDHATVVQTAYTGANHQKWSLNYDGDGYFYLTNANSAKVLDVASGSSADDAGIIQWPPEANDNQKWRVVDKGGGSYQLLNKLTGKVLVVPGGVATDGAALAQRTASTAGEHLWLMSPAN